MSAKSGPRLADAVSAKLERLSGGAPVAALTRDGVVTLFGAVGSEMRRLWIEEGVSHIRGVVRVRNYLRVAAS